MPKKQSGADVSATRRTITVSELPERHRLADRIEDRRGGLSALQMEQITGSMLVARATLRREHNTVHKALLKIVRRDNVADS
jgi:hypothetical protein